MERERFDFDLKPGESGEIEIRALPIRRAVRIVATAELTPGKAPVTSVTSVTSVTPMAAVARQEGWPRVDATWRAPVVPHHYTVTKHDVSLMQIARFMYGNADLWPKIWLANLDHLASPESLRSGQRLRVPDDAPLTRAEIAARDSYVARQGKR